MLNVFNMEATLGLNADQFNSGLNNAENNTKDLSATTVAVGQVMADAFEAVIAKVGEFASSVVTAGEEEETALAKVQTIMDSSVVSTDSMNNAIKEMSDQMGVSVADISDAVYNAISATGDTAGAVNLVEQATKLASAGFTDTSSALSVLTTAMNAYGDEAGSVEHISDSLMTVQNKGVTTVAELASSMGKAIASASAYGVNLENLESSYISITKAGINTAEGTTYISSMLKELGDSGSDVSGVLKEKTGKSFDQLMANGSSLGDVLKILSDSVDGDSTALMNLWSSAEAGKASSAIVGQGIEEFNQNLQDLQTTSGTTQTAYETMSDTFEHRQEVLNTNLENMKASLFEEFEPMLETLIGFVQENVVPILDWCVNNMDLVAPIVLGIVTALGGLAIALNVTKWITALKGAVLALNLAMSANPIGIVIALLAGLVVAIIALWNSNEDFRNAVIEIWGVVKEEFSKAVEFIKEKFEAMKEAIGKLKEYFSERIEATKQAFQNLVTAIENVKNNIINKFTELKNKFTALVDSFKTIGSNIVHGLWDGISSGWTWLTNKVQELADGLVQGVKNVLGIHSPSKVFAEIGDYSAQGFGEGFEKAFGNVKKSIVNDMDFKAVKAPASYSSQSNDNLSAQLEELNNTMEEKMARAISTLSFEWNDRQLGRMVRTYA